ncbi:hypothetical protein LJR045_000790 [Microbacterium sp. LjRoot45]|uniref:hypothetical protein n=1 Tax=Microbacterium sp. LjRoot45 TaxID=3342329 RepID=UPI003ECCDD88
MLDWNISARIENIHRRQARFEPLNLTSTEIQRLRRLVLAIPRGAAVLGAFAAAEPETRRAPQAHDVSRYNARTDVASVYLAQAPGYLLHLLDGGDSGGLVIDSVADDYPYEPDPFRAWFMISYATFLKAASLHRERLNSRRERVERFATWLEHELRVSPGQEAWIGFKLLAGRGDQPGKAERLLKLGRPRGSADAVWGATWDLMYTRIPAMMTVPPLRGTWPLPILFVTDDAALVDVFDGRSSPFLVTNANGVTLDGGHVDLTLLHDDVQPIVRNYLKREKLRVLTRSPGVTDDAMNRAAALAQSLEPLFE